MKIGINYAQTILSDEASLTEGKLAFNEKNYTVNLEMYDFLNKMDKIIDYSRPNIKNIEFERDGGEFTIGVPLTSSEKSYKLERRGGMGHDPGPSTVKGVYGDRSGFEGPVKHSSGVITEYFVTFYE